MASWDKPSARTAIDGAEAAALDPSAVVLDGLRRRPRYFDGRFLTGADLTRDQAYVRQRQADLARAGGTGVVRGLQVTRTGAAAGDRLTIAAGHGVTPAGDLVLVETARDIDLLDLPAIERLDFAFGLRVKPRLPLGRRSGLFVLALRPVEFTANPIAAYPTTIDGSRSIQDGDVIEATAVTLIPYPEAGAAGSLDDARRLVARRLFIEDNGRGLPQEALPLAMLALERGAIRWIDAALVRRETGADTPLVVTMGGRPRALAEAFVVQHAAHLADMLVSRAGNGAFAAAQGFAALPAAGQLPAAAILPDDAGFRQLWFPPAVDVDIGFAPEDEIGALVEDSLSLPPFDLASAEALDGSGVVVLAPVTRARLQAFERALDRLTQTAVSAPGAGLRRAPATLLRQLVDRRATRAAVVRDPAADARVAAASAQASAWRAAWADAVAALPEGPGGAKLLWYVRRRAAPDVSRVEGAAVTVTGDDAALDRQLDARLGSLELTARVKAIEDAATPFAAARVAGLLGTPRIIGSDLLLIAAVHALEAAVPPAPAPVPLPLPLPEVPVPIRPGAGPGVGPVIRPGVGPVVSPVASPVSGPVIRPVPGRLVASPVLALRPGSTRIALSQLSTVRVALRAAGIREKLDEGDVVDVAEDFTDPAVGDGIDRLVAALGDPPLDADAIRFLGESGLALDLDAAGRDVPAAELAATAGKLRDVAGRKDAAALADLVAAAG